MRRPFPIGTIADSGTSEREEHERDEHHRDEHDRDEHERDARIPDTAPAWAEPARERRATPVIGDDDTSARAAPEPYAVSETWRDRQARIFAPPVGQRPHAAPMPPGVVGTVRPSDLAADPGRRTSATDAIAERIDPAPIDHAIDPGTPVATGRVSPSAIMSGAAGAVLGAWAVVALARAGLGRPLRTPIVEVGGFTTTAILALLVLGAGALLVLAATSRSRAVVASTGLLVTGAAVALAVEPAFGDGALAAESDFAIAVAILSGITTMVAVLAADVPRRRRADRRADRRAGRADQRSASGPPDRADGRARRRAHEAPHLVARSGSWDDPSRSSWDPAWHESDPSWDERPTQRVPTTSHRHADDVRNVRDVRDVSDRRDRRTAGEAARRERV